MSEAGFDLERSEVFLNYYDIFVRNAFLNLRDILTEVVFSPLMGKYLEHTGTSSYSHNGFHPNEKFARDFLQLFTIGLIQLQPDGSPVRVDGKEVPAFGKMDVMHAARVFTGFENQADRPNIETFDGNAIDPMFINPELHDLYPKSSPDGKLLGHGCGCAFRCPPCGRVLRSVRVLSSLLCLF